MLRLLQALGLGGESARASRGTIHDRLADELGHLGEERVEYLAAFAGLLARAALGDDEISPEEDAAMRTCLEKTAGLPAEQAELVATIARNAAETLSGIEDYLLTRAFNEHASRDEKDALLTCLFEVAGADGVIAGREDDEIKQIGKALLIPHSRIIELRSVHRDRLEVLQNLPSS